MIIVNVYVSVKPEYIQDFKLATIENAKNSIKEPGVIRFDFVQQEDEPSNFLLIEIYKNEDAILAHKQTSHYLKWKETVENMMAQPRKSVKYHAVYPDNAKW